MTKTSVRIAALAAMIHVLTHTAPAQTPLGTEFTYQGRLKDAGGPANGLHDLRFRLYDALSGGAQIGATLCADNVSVTDGLFTVPLDFGAQFAGQERFLEIDVRADSGLDCANPAGFVILVPRQALTAAPYALHSLGPWQTAESAVFYDAGNVGIGTNTPFGKLDVRDEGLSIAHLEGASTLGAWLSIKSSTPAGHFWGIVSTGTDNGEGPGDLVFYDGTAGMTRLDIDGPTGNVGIGTTTPVGKLDVRDAGALLAHLDGTSTLGAWLNIKSSTPDGHQWSIISTGTDNGEGPGDLVFYDGTTGITRMDIDGPTGNIGIGTISPENKLHIMKGSAGEVTGYASAPLVVENSTHAYINLLTPDANERGILFGETSSNVAGGIIYNAAATPDGFQFRTGGNVTRMVIDSNGDVGIGTTSPGTGKLDVRSPSGNAGYFESASTTGAGVFSTATAASGISYGVYGRSASTSGRGVFGQASATSGTIYGVYGFASTAAAGYAVYAAGDFGASGTKSFRIDHPDDPANKYLLHYAAESPEVINFYRGTVTLNGAGETIVELPHYFAKINKQPSYQLTALGAAMPNLHVAEKISELSLDSGARAGPEGASPTCWFRIAGGAPGGEVSWRVEAVRNDRLLRTHVSPVEIDKQGVEKGTYQHPELYGQPPETGMNYDGA